MPPSPERGALGITSYFARPRDMLLTTCVARVGALARKFGSAKSRSKKGGVCKAAVKPPPDGSMGGLGLYAAEAVEKDAMVLCEPCEITIVLDFQRCIYCNEFLPGKGYGGIKCECNAETYCSKRCQKHAWNTYHKAQCGAVARQVEKLRNQYWTKFVEMEGRGLEQVYMALMIVRIAAMIQCKFMDSSEAGGATPGFDLAAWRKNWPAFLGTPSRLTDNGAEEIIGHMQHPFTNWFPQWRQLAEALCLFEEDIYADPRGMVWCVPPHPHPDSRLPTAHTPHRRPRAPRQPHTHPRTPTASQV